MKTITLFFGLLITGLSLAQTGINYKAVVKDVNGNVLANQNISVGFTISNDDDSSDFYSETHNPVVTDSNGVFMVNIGEGVLLGGDLNAINWSDASYSLTTFVNIDGTTAVNMGTVAFKAVPYALTSKKITNAPNRALEVAGVGTQKIRINSTNNDTPSLQLMKTGEGIDWEIQNSGDWLDLIVSEDDYINNDIKFSFNKDGQFGINTFNPTEELDVVGTIRSRDLAGSGNRNVVANASGNLVIGSEPSTHYLSLNTSTFYASKNGYPAQTARIGVRSLSADDNSGALNFYGPITLPHGATITKIKVYFKDDSTSDITFQLFGENKNGIPSDFQSISYFESSGNSPNLQTLESGTLNQQINNLDFSYVMGLYSLNWNSKLVVHGVTITYTLP